MIVVGICRLVDPVNNLVGRTSTGAIMLDVGYIFGNTAMFAGVCAYLIRLSTFLKGYALMMGEEARELVEIRLKLVSYAVPVVMLVSFVQSSFIGLVYIQPAVSDWLLIGYIGSNLIAMGCFGAMTVFLYHLVIAELEKIITSAMTNPNINSGEISKAHRKLKRDYLLFSRSVFFSVPPNVFFLGWHYLRRKFDYLTAIQMLAVCFSTTVTISMGKISKLDQDLSAEVPGSSTHGSSTSPLRRTQLPPSSPVHSSVGAVRSVQSTRTDKSSANTNWNVNSIMRITSRFVPLSVRVIPSTVRVVPHVDIVTTDDVENFCNEKTAQSTPQSVT